MKLLRVTCSVLLAASVVGVAPAARAAGIASPVKANWESVFDTSRLPDKTRTAAEDAIEAFDFDWTKLEPGLGGRRIIVSLNDLAAFNAVGAAWPAPVTRIDIDDDVEGHPIWVKAVMLHELGHVVDFFYLQSAGLNDDVAAIYGRDWDTIAHSFNAAFVSAFTRFEAVDNAYPLDRAQVRQLRELLGGTNRDSRVTSTRRNVERLTRIVTAYHLD